MIAPNSFNCYNYVDFICDACCNTDVMYLWKLTKALRPKILLIRIIWICTNRTPVTVPEHLIRRRRRQSEKKTKHNQCNKINIYIQDTTRRTDVDMPKCKSFIIDSNNCMQQCTAKTVHRHHVSFGMSNRMFMFKSPVDLMTIFCSKVMLLDI